MARTVDVFFYDLFMDPQCSHNKGLHPTNPRMGHVQGMALQIKDLATLISKVSERVYGMVIGLA